MLDSINNLGEGTFASLLATWSEIAAFLPNLAGALVILVLGYLVAKIASAVVRRLLAAVGFDRLGERTGVADLLKHINVDKTASYILGRIVFWILMLTFLVAGEVKAVGATSIVLATSDGDEACVPNMSLLRNTVFVDLPPREPDEDAPD